MENKKTLVIGASTHPGRYSNMAINSLRNHNHSVIALAKRAGKVGDVDIQTEFPVKEDIHTVTMYIGAERQKEYYQALLAYFSTEACNVCKVLQPNCNDVIYCWYGNSG